MKSSIINRESSNQRFTIFIFSRFTHFARSQKVIDSLPPFIYKQQTDIYERQPLIYSSKTLIHSPQTLLNKSQTDIFPSQMLIHSLQTLIHKR